MMSKTKGEEKEPVRRKVIFLVEQDKDYVNKFRMFFKKEYEIITASGEEEALEIYAENNTDIDIVVMGSVLGGKDNCDILAEIKSFHDVPGIVLLETREPEPQIMAYRKGANDCVSKKDPLLLLKMKMEAVLKMVYGLDNSIQEGILELDLEKKTLKVEEEYIDITIKEFDLLYYFMRNKHAIQSRDQIITAVWGINYEGSDRVVDSLVKKLRLKLKKASNYIHTAYGMGYYFELPMRESA